MAASIAGATEAASKISTLTDRVDDASDRLEQETKRLIDEIAQVPASVSQMASELGDKMDAFSGVRATQETGSFPEHVLSINAGTNLALYALAVGLQEGQAVNTNEIKDNTTPYFAGLVFGFLSAMRAFSPCNTVLEYAAGAFTIKSAGDLNLEKLVQQDFSAQSYTIRHAKWAIDKSMGLANDSDKPEPPEEEGESA